MGEARPEGFTKGLKGRGRNFSGCQKFVVFRRSSKKFLINSTQINFICEEPVRKKKLILFSWYSAAENWKQRGWDENTILGEHLISISYYVYLPLFYRKRQQFYVLNFFKFGSQPSSQSSFTTQKFKWIIKWSRNTNDTKFRIWGALCPASLPPPSWGTSPGIPNIVRERLDSTTLGVFSNLKDSRILIQTSWKCFKSTNVFANIQVFQLGTTKAWILWVWNSWAHLGITCPNFQESETSDCSSH